MIKRTIGTLAVLASLAVMVLVALNRHDFSSMVLDGRPATEIPTQPAPYTPKPGPAENRSGYAPDGADLRTGFGAGR